MRTRDKGQNPGRTLSEAPQASIKLRKRKPRGYHVGDILLKIPGVYVSKDGELWQAGMILPDCSALHVKNIETRAAAWAWVVDKAKLHWPKLYR